MFDFWDFYNDLETRSWVDDKYWDDFPSGKLMRFKEEIFYLLKRNIEDKDDAGIAATLAIMRHDGLDHDYTDSLLLLLDEKWHYLVEDIVEMLGKIRDPKSIDKLYQLAINIPENDDMRALAKKCIWSLSTIDTPESIQKLQLLSNSTDWIIQEDATFRLKK